MNDRQGSLDSRYFEDIYTRTLDPWGFRTSLYEHGKYRATLDILPRPRYRAALEVGCSIGVFTRMLAGRCDAVLALDTSPRALAEAQRASTDLPHVAFGEATLPRDFPDGRFDLIVLSEVLYYLSRPDLALLAQRCQGALEQGGQMVLCHWLGETDYPLGGDEAADAFIAAAAPGWRLAEARREPQYRLDLLAAVA